MLRFSLNCYLYHFTLSLDLSLTLAMNQQGAHFTLCMGFLNQNKQTEIKKYTVTGI